MNLKAISAGLLALWLGCDSGLGCGGCYDSRLLNDGSSGMLVAPEANFRREIETLKLVAPFRAMLTTNSHIAEACGAELIELKQALERSAKSQAQTARILQEFEAQRNVFQQHIQQRLHWQVTNTCYVASTNPFPEFLKPGAAQVPKDLPPEFADYFRGAIAWHCGLTNEAVAAWESLLARPPKERHYRSTWAAFMLGRAVWENSPGRGIRYFQQVRSLAEAGFADSLGLAAASIGAEARVEYRRENYARAIHLYLDQVASGDGSAYNSLRFVAAAVLRNRATSLKALATDARVQPVITAYIISGGWSDGPVDVDGVISERVIQLMEKQTFVSAPAGGWHKLDSPARLWLEAIEASRVRDVAAVEKLALAAYQCGEFTIAARWIDRAPDSATGQWLKSKLLLREGRVEEAATLLAKLVRQFPTDVPQKSVDTNATLFNRIAVWSDHCDPVRIPPVQMLGELGALHLARREYAEALDALLRSGYTEDAAYVADRVLTIAELRTYVERNWPSAKPDGSVWQSWDTPWLLRSVLGRRLFRERRFAEAREFFDAESREFIDLFEKAATEGQDATKPKDVRAALLWQCAQAVYQEHNVLQPPVGTDWSTYSGNFSYTSDMPERIQSLTKGLVPVTQEERDRVLQTSTFPDRQWHYRFMAAKMAWDAAQLMPDNTDETARVLWQGGTWIKYADPKAADVFYKALVRRCRKTALGDAADHRRWFPSLDEHGNIVPFKPRDGTTKADDI